MRPAYAALLVPLPFALAQNASTTSSVSFSATPVTTSVPSPTSPLNSSVPGQDTYPPAQYWCNAGQPDVYCPSVLLQDVELSGIFSDSKPTVGTLNDTLAAFNALPVNRTVGDIENFVNQYFKGEGLELEQVAIEGFVSDPAILNNISDPVFKAWVSEVNSYWQLLIRQTNQSALCESGVCESSLIPLNNTIVVPGGRYREIYYWDSYWILHGLLSSELYTYAVDLLENFMDLIETYGFLPNGGRKYYLDRSQPPVFVQMIDTYVTQTGNTSILARALPILSTELAWWQANRTVNVTSPYTQTQYTVAHYAVNNSAPRPEGYVEDYETAFGASPPLNESARADLYAELASGAETGWDYSARWARVPVINVSDNYPALRTLNTRAIVPVDLNALLAGNHALLAKLYTTYADSAANATTATANATSGTPANGSEYTAQIEYHTALAANYSAAVLDLMWDADRAYFYDFNTSANARSDLYTPAGLWPLWQNITPPGLAGNETKALEIVSGTRYLLGRYAGIPTVATLLYTGLNWDFPNSWPPHVYTTIMAFEQIGRLVNTTVLTNLTLDYAGVAPGQLGLNETDLQPQPASTVGNTSLQTAEAQGKPWDLALGIEIANRYMSSAFCSWYSTGGEIDGLLTQLPLSDLNSTGTYTAGQTGVMFEKFNATDPDAAGGGGEYTVQIGFGWTNGVVLWLAGALGQYLPAPTCPLIPIIEVEGGQNVTSYANGTELDTRSMAGNKRFAGYRRTKDWRAPH
ncbi:hypothetical protein Q5752_003124 [Cryptotrichosporon argae]